MNESSNNEQRKVFDRLNEQRKSMLMPAIRLVNDWSTTFSNINKQTCLINNDDLLWCDEFKAFTIERSRSSRWCWLIAGCWSSSFRNDTTWLLRVFRITMLEATITNFATARFHSLLQSFPLLAGFLVYNSEIFPCVVPNSLVLGNVPRTFGPHPCDKNSHGHP